MIEEVIARALADLEELGARVCVVGGLAVSVRSEPRFTRDVDVAVAAVDDREAERLVRDLGARGYRMLFQVEHEKRSPRNGEIGTSERNRCHR